MERASRVFRMGEVEVPALVDVDLAVSAGEMLVILGPLGSGKSTLLNLVGGMDRPMWGQVWHRSAEISLCLVREARSMDNSTKLWISK